MDFTAFPSRRRPHRGSKVEAFLVPDNWNDFGYRTLFQLYVSDSSGEPHQIGNVKIGQVGMGEGKRSVGLVGSFQVLAEDFFSLGQDDSYYLELSKLDEQLRRDILNALRDVAADEALLSRALNEDVMKVSLLREVTVSTVRGQFRRITQGGLRLSRFLFSYEANDERGQGPSLRLTFDVNPESSPPTNIHVLIGRNGVGKTYLLSQMTESLLAETSEDSAHGKFVFDEPASAESARFANIVAVSFSAFDDIKLIPDRKPGDGTVGYATIGLRQASDTGERLGNPKSPMMLAAEFVSSFRECLIGARASRWRKAIDTLQSDPAFNDSDILSLASGKDGDPTDRASALFERLSSGHKITLLTISKLVQLVEERTLVLFDEPEAHLHPPLLSALIRAVSDLLILRNGVAVVATHSPVVLQEVPRSCVWIIRRTGFHSVAERPAIETFGENVGVLTREVFQLEVTYSGFHALLEKAVQRHPDFDSVLAEFGHQLGAGAQVLVRALLASEDGARKDRRHA